MVKRNGKSNAVCPVERSLDIIGDRWSLLIIRDAFDGLRRFGEFQKSLGMARNILADRLRKLVAAEILAVTPCMDTAYQEYVLTPKGEALFPVILGMRQWGEHYLFERGEAHSRLVERASGKKVKVMEPKTCEGQILKPGDTMVEKI